MQHTAIWCATVATTRQERFTVRRKAQRNGIPSSHTDCGCSVYNLRTKFAEPGTVVTPPSSSPHRRKSSDIAVNSDVDVDSEDDEDGRTEPNTLPEFDLSYCIFCGVNSNTFDDNLIHMSKAHSFSIPYRENLVVEVPVLVKYLHLVIYGYGQCILCSTHRHTVEGIQHHMAAKGHCRLNVTDEFSDFYNLPDRVEFHADEESLRLPSGKLLSHRTKVASTKTAPQPVERRSRFGALPNTTSSSRNRSELTSANDLNLVESSSTQLSRLTKGDQQSLAHLPDHELRSLLADHTKSIDQARRAKHHAEVKLSKAENTILMGNFRADTSKRFQGPWG